MFGWFTDLNRFSALGSTESFVRRVGWELLRATLPPPANKRRRRVVDLSGWDQKAERPKTKVDVQQTWAIVDDLGRPCLIQAILFSPQVMLFPQDAELMNVTLMSNKETAERLLAAAQNKEGFHVVPYKS